MNTKKLTLHFMLFLSFLISAVNSWADDVFLMVTVKDESFLNDTEVKMFEDYIRSQIGDMKLVSISFEKFFLEGLNDAIHLDLKKKIAATDTIENLLIFTHGNTEIDSMGKSSTQLTGLGQITEKSVSEKIKSHFKSIKNNFSPRAHISFLSCDAFCGSDTQIKSRANSLLNYFNIPYGSVFGANTAMYGHQPITSENIDKMTNYEYQNFLDWKSEHDRAMAQISKQDRMFGLVMGATLLMSSPDILTTGLASLAGLGVSLFRRKKLNQFQVDKKAQIKRKLERKIKDDGISIEESFTYRHKGIKGHFIFKDGSNIELQKMEGYKANFDRLFINHSLPMSCQKALK